jgi:UDPglucose 6-dehydrogenase
MTITFIGAGYVGLVTAAVFADLGNTVYVIDNIPEKIKNLNKGIIPIYEPGLEETIKRNIHADRLHFILDYNLSIGKSDAVFIAVGTPPKPSGEADLSAVFAVAQNLGQHLNDYTVVITKSTVPVGTSKKIKEIIAAAKPKNASFDYASVPEFLREGQALSDTFHPDRVVIGTDAKKARDLLVELHQPILSDGDKEAHLIMTNIPTAEMIKYASNAFLATKISFANAIAQLSEITSADGLRVLEAIGLDKRIGSSFLYPGAGYGGSCLPKDVKALISIAKQYNYDFNLLEAVETINNNAITNIVTKTEKLLDFNLKDKTIGILGLSFKPNTDDMRDAPSIPIIRELIKRGAKIKAFDPIALDNARKIFANDKNIQFVVDSYSAAEDTNLLIILTEWNEFRQINLNIIKKLMKNPRIVDGRNIYEPAKTKALGFAYVGVGR